MKQLTICDSKATQSVDEYRGTKPELVDNKNKYKLVIINSALVIGLKVFGFFVNGSVINIVEIATQWGATQYKPSLLFALIKTRGVTLARF